MTKDQLSRRQIRSMARSMEVEGANFQETEKSCLTACANAARRNPSMDAGYFVECSDVLDKKFSLTDFASL